MAIVEASGLTKSYGRVEAVRGVTLAVEEGDFVTIMGPSGSGKTTLLQLLGALERPSTGTVRLGGEAVDGYSDAKLSAFRRRKLGFVFQFFHLLPTLTAEENVLLPLLLDGRGGSKARDRARALLAEMGLADRAEHRPHQLSGGEMQRVAIARALAAEPIVLFADEPTGNLDSKTGAGVLELLARLSRERKQTCVMVTHDPKAARVGERLVLLRDGVIEKDGPPASILGES
jgi:putative ABC transport system ATP-binding protein